MLTGFLFFVVILLSIGFWVQHREIKMLIEFSQENEQMVLNGVWLLKKHLIETHKVSFKDADKAEPAEAVG